MKIILPLLIVLAFLKGYPQEKPFTINGTIKGENTFLYAYAFDSDYKILQKSKIENGKFLLKGSYLENQRFGAIPNIIILLSNEEENKPGFLANRPLSSRRHFNTTIIAEAEINVYYDIVEKKFTIEAGKLNALQSKFNNIYYDYRKSRDSVYLEVEKINLTPTERDNKKADLANELFNISVSKMIDLVKENPSSKVALSNFWPITLNQSTAGKVVLDLFSNLSNELQNSDYGVYVLKGINDKIKNEELTQSPKYDIGSKFPAYELPNQLGVIIKSNFEGTKFTLVDFWATWCGPCRKEMPNLIAASNKFKHRGLRIISISIDDNSDKNKWLEALKQDNMQNLTNLFNGSDKSGLARILGISTIPANYLLDENGLIIAKNLRGDELNNVLEKSIK